MRPPRPATPRHSSLSTPYVPLAAALRVSERAFDVALRFAGGERLTLVVLAFATRQAQLYLDHASLVVQRQRHDGVPALFRFARQPGDLAPVQQQLAGAGR